MLPRVRGGPADDKVALRVLVLTRRSTMTRAEQLHAAEQLAARVLAEPAVAAAATVAAYVSVGREPATGAVRAALRARGTRVLLPLLQPDGDLDWAVDPGDAGLRPAGRGLLEPPGPPLGPDAVSRADVLLVPGVAGDVVGGRLGRGGGSYDRALRRAHGLRVLLLHDGEVADHVPVEDHDEPVHLLLAPSSRTATVAWR